MDPATHNHDNQRHILAVTLGWASVFLACVLAYWPGLTGPFMLDDFGSIVDLGDRGGIRDWETFKAFVFGGHAGPTGRPLALLSFLIDANNWPTDPWPFKRTNLAIHLVSGATLGFLTAKILQLLQVEKRNARWIAVVSSACWLLHPFLVSCLSNRRLSSCDCRTGSLIFSGTRSPSTETITANPIWERIRAKRLSSDC